MEELFNKIVVPLLIGGASAFFAARFALHKYRAERLWDRRINAYSELIDALYEMKSVRDSVMEIERHGGNGDAVHHEELWERSRKARKHINKAAGTASLILSDECAKSIYTMEKELSRVLGDVSATWTELISTEYIALDKCLKEIKLVARKELKL